MAPRIPPSSRTKPIKKGDAPSAPRALNDTDFHALKEQALDLVDWVLADMSPDEQHKIHLKMGIEREGCFLYPKEHKFWTQLAEEQAKPSAIVDAEIRHDAGMQGMAFAVEARTKRDVEAPHRIVCERAGNFLLEAITEPDAPKQAARNMSALCRSMSQFADEQGYRHGFGSVQVEDYLQSVPSFGPMVTKGNKFAKSGTTCFDTPTPHIPGMGQHANISPWCGTQNLLCRYDVPTPGGGLSGLPFLIVNEAAKTVPGMALICRNGNYRRILEGGGLAPVYARHTINMKRDYAFSIVTQKSRVVDSPYDVNPDITRIEFRHSCADAEPIDDVLSAAIPVAKTIVDRVKLNKQGKATLVDGALKGKFAEETREYHSREEDKLPDTLEKAKEAFNPENGVNPNFAFLDKLAEIKIQRLTEAAKKGGAAEQQVLREAEGLRHIGARLHHGYCQRHGMQSHMPFVAGKDTHAL